MIYVECKADKIVIENLGVLKEEICHCGGKGRVMLKLTKGEKNCGLIDEDPGCPQPKILKNFNKKSEKYDLKILYDEKGNKLIVVSPTIEGWILKVAKKNEIDVKKYELPEDFNELHRIINIYLDSLRKLLDELRKTEEFSFLKKLLVYKNE